MGSVRQPEVLSHFGPIFILPPSWRTQTTLLEKSGGSVTLVGQSMNDSVNLSVTKTAKQYHHSDSAALVPCSLRLEPNEMHHYASTAQQHHRSDFPAAALCSTRFEFNEMKRLPWSVEARKYPIHCAQFGHTNLPSEALKARSKQLFENNAKLSSGVSGPLTLQSIVRTINLHFN